MDSKIKEEGLKNFALSVMEYLEYKEEIEYLLSKLNLTKEEVIQAYINYDMDVFAYENEIYESLAMRMVLHLHYLLKGSWHQDRQKEILKIIVRINPESIVDMGFGTPTRYIREYVLKEKKKLVLVDLYESAFRFSKVLLDYLASSWKEIISFKKIDMNTHEYPGDFDAYLFQDSIEHVENSGDYLLKIVKKSPLNSRFILSLPIGPKVPAHTISWDTDEEAINWLKECGLKVIDSKRVFINPNVDLFADQLDGKLHNLVVDCSKLNNNNF